MHRSAKLSAKVFGLPVARVRNPPVGRPRDQTCHAADHAMKPNFKKTFVARSCQQWTTEAPSGNVRALLSKIRRRVVDGPSVAGRIEPVGVNGRPPDADRGMRQRGTGDHQQKQARRTAIRRTCRVDVSSSRSAKAKRSNRRLHVNGSLTRLVQRSNPRRNSIRRSDFGNRLSSVFLDSCSEGLSCLPKILIH